MSRAFVKGKTISPFSLVKGQMISLIPSIYEDYVVLRWLDGKRAFASFFCWEKISNSLFRVVVKDKQRNRV